LGRGESLEVVIKKLANRKKEGPEHPGRCHDKKRKEGKGECEKHKESGAGFGKTKNGLAPCRLTPRRLMGEEGKG